MPAAFEIKNVAPQYLSVPEELKYDYMIYRLSKILNQSPNESEQLSEKDFWLFAGFENLENLRTEYYIENKSRIHDN